MDQVLIAGIWDDTDDFGAGRWVGQVVMDITQVNSSIVAKSAASDAASMQSWLIHFVANY